MSKKYSLKELANITSPSQLGYSPSHDCFIFRPYDLFDPSLNILLLNSGWNTIRGVEGVYQAFATLENWLQLKNSGINFIPTKKLSNWLNKTLSILANSSDHSKKDIDFSNSKLFDYQCHAVVFLASHRRAMLSLSPGLGKTITSAFAAGVQGFQKVLVVCPASLLFYWKGELEKWADQLPMNPLIDIFHRKVGLDGVDRPNHAVSSSDQFVEVETEDGKKIYVASGCTWHITNPETAIKHLDQLVEQRYDCMIVDESIMYKHRGSQRSKAIKELAQEIPTTWLLTGAPATRYLDDMWHQFHILKPKGYASYWRFAKQYCIVQETEWGDKVVANKPDAEKEIKLNFSDVYFSKTQDDVANIPDWLMEDIDIPMLPAQNKTYEKLRKELLIELDTLDPKDVIRVSNHLSLMIRSVQVASNPLLVGAVDSAGKWDALPELMSIYPGPYIVWVNFIPTGEILRDRFSRGDYKINGKTPRIALANGSTPMQDRNSMVDSMQNGNLDVLILNNQVGKFGFTLTKARTAIFVERMYDDSYFQCLHRNRRIGTTVSPIIVNMRAVTQNGRRTIDHTIHSVLDYRTNMIKVVTAGMLKETFKDD